MSDRVTGSGGAGHPEVGGNTMNDAGTTNDPGTMRHQADQHRRIPVPVQADGHPTCSCGQELDVCHHAHCPRCGHRLVAREPVLVG
jgi:hypothetical protein